MESNSVTLVIPGRNCQRTLHDCLDAAMTILQAGSGALREIIFVDDASTDETAKIAATYPIRVISGPGGGPGAARNLGWRAAETPLVWFIDSDCVAEPEALDLLIPLLTDADVAGVSGSYGNMHPGFLLASLIHEEIMLRHAKMPTNVNFLGGFNVLYRREVLEKVGGFDESQFNGPASPGAEDAELAYRVAAAGHQLRFEPRSRVRHFHPTRLLRYLRSQRHHGYWRVFLHMAYRHTAKGDDYSNWVDHSQPTIALAMVATLPFLTVSYAWWIPIALASALVLLQLPLTLGLLARTNDLKYLAFIPMGFVRAIWRSIGMAQGLIAYKLVKRSARAENQT